MGAKAGLFAVGPSPDEEDDDDLSDFSGDLEDLDPTDEGELDSVGGPFDDYAATVFDDKADPAARSDALRQAILTVLEEKGQA